MNIGDLVTYTTPAQHNNLQAKIIRIHSDDELDLEITDADGHVSYENHCMKVTPNSSRPGWFIL